MGDLSRHFSRAEAVFSQTASRQNIENTPPPDIWTNIEQAAGRADEVRELLANHMIISSWYRSLKLNRAVGSEDTSDHINGWCIDFICPEAGSPYKVAAKIMASGLTYDQLIQEGQNPARGYEGWVHISFAPRMRQMILHADFDANGRAHYTAGLKP